jgi:lactoylglutathione lyase
MRALHFGLRVTDLERSRTFYRAVGYEVVGEVPDTDIGHLTMLALPDDDFVTLELVHHPAFAPGDGDSPLSHFVIQVEDMQSTRAQLIAGGVDVDEPSSPDGSSDFWTAMLADPDGNRIELVQWPPGHADGITAADSPE